MGLKRLRRAVVALLFVTVGALTLSARWITDLWWFEELGYQQVFWTRTLAPWAVGLAATLILGAFFTFNIRYAAQAWHPIFFRLGLRVPWATADRVHRLLPAAGLLLGVLFARAVASQWEIVASYVHRVPFGRVDPLFGLDLGFYFFSLPFYRLVHLTAAGAFLVAFILSAVVYAAARAVNWSERGLYMDPRPRRHLLYLGAGLLLLKAADYRFQQLELVYSTRGVVFGAGYTDTYVVLPLLWMMIALCVGGALILVRGARTGLGRPAVVVAVLFAASVLLLEMLPGIVQKSLVEPNEIVRESPFIARTIALTRFGYDLDRIEEREFQLRDDLDAQKLVAHDGTIQNVRLWDWRPMHSSFRQLQEIRFYYRFADVDVARYRVAGRLRQVMTAVRELDVTQINNRTWINEHLQYTHGYGLVMSPVNETTPEGLPLFWIQDIPPRSAPHAPRIERPEIYFGELTDRYALVGTRIPEFDYPMGDENAWSRYEGRGGIPVNNLLRRFLFAVRTGDAALLLSNNLTEETRILMRRQVAERVRTVAPFLRYDRDPYAVVADGRIFWIVDAYTVSSALPYSQPVRGWGNYVRNAVKVVVDAYHGDVTFYAFDPDDPLLKVYQAIYPTLFTPLEAMPPALREHVRYPEDLFLLQARMYSVYHMSNPSIFYNQEDVWHVAREIYRGQEQEMSPYYTILQLPGEAEPEMVLMLPLTPARRNNMIAWLAARNDGEHYGRLIVYRFPKDQLVFGPMQVEARIDQEPSISEALTLWDQAGSQVLRGNMLVLPLDGNLLYVKPIFLRAETGELPELVRVIVAYGPRLVMTRTLDEALTALFGSRTPGLRAAGPEGEGGVAREGGEAGDAGPAGGTADGEALSRLAARAWRAWEAAQEALRRGDWTGYGAALAQLEALLREMASR